MKSSYKHRLLTLFIAFVWFGNGLFCKVLNLVPRHKEIVSRILGNDYASTITILIGISEVIMGIWVLTKIKSKLNAILQMTVVGTMNILEFILAPDLLLWGRLNSVFALLFIILVYYNEFILNKQNPLETK